MAVTPEDILNIEKDIVYTLKNIYDLGLVYEIDVDPDGTANIRMTLTAPNCPMADMLVEEVQTQVRKVNGVTDLNLTLTFDPPWSRDMMSQEALLELGML